MDIHTHFTLKRAVLLALFLAAVIFHQFYNLGHTARFTQDESSDLVRMRQYYTERKLSLVGPISSDNSKVFSSLTYYMVMPFAAATGFEPIGPVYGTAFWGVLTAVVLLVVTAQVNRRFLVPGALLLIVWLPLVEMSRWAWNPHFVAFWAGLGLLVYFARKKLGSLSFALVGFFFGMMFHHHYLSLIAVAPLMLYFTMQLWQQKQYRDIALMAGGYFFSIVPFLLFDLRQPPGLFFTQYLLGGSTPHVETTLTLELLWEHAARNLRIVFESSLAQEIWYLPLGLGVAATLWADVKAKQYNTIVWLTPLLTLFITGLFLNDFQARYVYPAIAFLYVWMLLPRKKFAAAARNVVFGVLLISALSSIHKELTVTKVPPDIYSFTKASHFIADTITEHQLVNPNIAVLASKDSAPLAEKYRDVVRMYQAGVRELNEYDATENLFVVSTSDEARVRSDESNAMVYFSKSELRDVYEVENSNWKVYWFSF